MQNSWNEFRIYKKPPPYQLYMHFKLYNYVLTQCLQLTPLIVHYVDVAPKIHTNCVEEFAQYIVQVLRFSNSAGVPRIVQPRLGQSLASL